MNIFDVRVIANNKTHLGQSWDQTNEREHLFRAKIICTDEYKEKRYSLKQK